MKILKVLVENMTISATDEFILIGDGMMENDVSLNAIVAAVVKMPINFMGDVIELGELVTPYIDSGYVVQDENMVWEIDRTNKYTFADNFDLSFTAYQGSDVPSLAKAYYDKLLLVDQDNHETIVVILKN